MSKTFIGEVVSDKMDKTVVVLVKRKVSHPFYRKVIIKRKKFYVHDEKGSKLGQMVEIKEVRPISKTKKFEVVKICS
ncbi:MAG: 30S ribosomal protein S17 [Patescibacteria group bacterium]|nr:30S ribosomal protein S17 [Patescibacteria group bacterium]